MYSARAGYEIVNEIGVAAIREKSQRQTQRLIALADEAGLTVRSPQVIFLHLVAERSSSTFPTAAK